MENKTNQTHTNLSNFFQSRRFQRKPWYRLLVALLFLGLLFTGAPQSFSKTTSTKINLNELDRYFEQARQNWQIPGMAVAIVKDGKIVLAKGYGRKEIAKEGNVDENTLFAIASNTKAFTAATLSILVDEGKIKWDDKVRSYLPYFQMYDPYVTEEITIRDLLCHRSGLGTFSGDLLWYETSYSTEDILKRVKYLKPAFGFRSGYGYSNLMFMAASEVVAAVTGKPWSEFIKERIFTPLGMTSTHCGSSLLKNYTNVATPHYIPTEEGATAITVPYTHSDSAAGAAAINSNVADMAQWLLMLLNDGKKENKVILSPKGINEMWQAFNTMRVSENFKKLSPTTHFRCYGLGWSLYDYQGYKVVQHGGALDGMISSVALVPELKLGIVVLTNSINNLPPALVNRAIDMYAGATPTDWSKMTLERTKEMEKKEKEEALKTTTNQPLPLFQVNLNDYVGTYVDELYGNVSISLENNALVFNDLIAPIFNADLSPLHYDTFTIKLRNKFSFIPKGTGTAQFSRNPEGKIIGLQLDIPNNDFHFTEFDFKKVEAAK